MKNIPPVPKKTSVYLTEDDKKLIERLRPPMVAKTGLATTTSLIRAGLRALEREING